MTMTKNINDKELMEKGAKVLFKELRDCAQINSITFKNIYAILKA